MDFKLGPKKWRRVTEAMRHENGPINPIFAIV